MMSGPKQPIERIKKVTQRTKDGSETAHSHPMQQGCLGTGDPGRGFSV